MSSLTIISPPFLESDSNFRLTSQRSGSHRTGDDVVRVRDVLVGRAGTAFVNFQAIDANVVGRGHADPDTVAADRHDGDADFVCDDDRLSHLSRTYQHFGHSKP